jgi:hypothetical protein
LAICIRFAVARINAAAVSIADSLYFDSGGLKLTHAICQNTRQQFAIRVSIRVELQKV